MKRIFLLTTVFAMLLCLSITAYAQDGEDSQTSDLPDYLLRENNLIANAYDINDEIRDYMGVEEGDQIVRILDTTGLLEEMFEETDNIFDLMDSRLQQPSWFRVVYAVRHPDGSITHKVILKDNSIVDASTDPEGSRWAYIADLPDAIWSYDTIRMIDPDIKVERAFVLRFSVHPFLPDGTHKALAVFYKTDLGDYVYFNRSQYMFHECPLDGEHLLPYEDFCSVMAEITTKSTGDEFCLHPDYSVDLTTYDIHSASFHIDVPERPNTGLYIALGIGGGLVLIAAVLVMVLGDSGKKARAAREIQM